MYGRLSIMMIPYDEDHDPMYDVNAAADYRREAYGAPCPRHGELTYGGDCSQCEAEADELDGNPDVR